MQAIALVAAMASVALGASPKRNLLLIMSDQHRWDALGMAGNTIIKTPVLDQLARDGVRFTNAYTICPTCR